MNNPQAFERREAEQLDFKAHMAQESRILGTPSPQVEGVVNLDDPTQAASHEEWARKALK